MKTEEMFKKIGYEYDYNEGEFEFGYVKKHTTEKYSLYIMFKRLTKEYYKVDGDKRRRAISIEEHKAINAQLQDLGWLK